MASPPGRPVPFAVTGSCALNGAGVEPVEVLYFLRQPGVWNVILPSVSGLSNLACVPARCGTLIVHVVSGRRLVVIDSDRAAPAGIVFGYGHVPDATLRRVLPVPQRVLHRA